jgi:hypothetical protein
VRENALKAGIDGAEAQAEVDYSGKRAVLLRDHKSEISRLESLKKWYRPLAHPKINEQMSSVREGYSETVDALKEEHTNAIARINDPNSQANLDLQTKAEVDAATTFAAYLHQDDFEDLAVTYFDTAVDAMPTMTQEDKQLLYQELCKSVVDLWKPLGPAWKGRDMLPHVATKHGLTPELTSVSFGTVDLHPNPVRQI